jgi:hypothetical protein
MHAHHPTQRPIGTPIVPAGPEAERRPTIVRPTVRDRDRLFRGWGPTI